MTPLAGFLWSENLEEALYRVSRDFDAVCLVETAFGEGTVLELASPVDQTLRVSYSSYAGDDNRGSDGGETVELQAGIPATVECTFYGFNFRYWVSIRAGNTKVELQIDP